MKRAQLYLVCMFVLAALAIPLHAFAFFGVEVGVGGWQQSPSGTMAYDKGALVGTNLDLENDLKYDDETKMLVRVKAELPLILPNLYFMATPMSFEGTGSKTATFYYGGQNFDASIPFKSELTLDHYDLALFYPIPLLKTATAGKLNIELGLNVRKIDYEGTINQPTSGKSASKDLTLYVPMVYAGVQIKPISALSIEAEVRGIAYGDNSYYDYLGRIKVKPIPLVFIAAGYRAETIEIDEDDVKVDLDFKGPFLEAGISF